MEMSDVTVNRMALIRIGLEALGHRLIAIIALALNCGVFVYALYWGDWQRLAGAGAFGIVSWLIVVIKPRSLEI